MRVRSDFKQCSICKQWLWKSRFPERRSGKDGLDYWCYECKSEHHRKRYIENRDVIREQQRESRIKNRNVIREQQRKSRIKNREKINERSKKRYIENREKINEQNRKYYMENPEKRAAISCVNNAIRKNEFPPPTMCVVCSSTENVQYHHESYEREHYLLVVPVCKLCHKRLHAFYKIKENNQITIEGDEQIAKIVQEEFLSLYRREKECV